MVNVRPAGRRISLRVAPGSHLDAYLDASKQPATQALHDLATQYAATKNMVLAIENSGLDIPRQVA